LHALGELDEAEKALTEAVEVYTQAYKGRHYLSGIAEVYLGLVAGDKKDLSASLAHFAEAKLHYDESYGEIHANHGDLLVNQATVLAALGEKERANQDCEAGMQILEDTLGKESGFTKQLQTVCDDIKAQ
jgi:tetratricopeptide (TPR) repeat protein